MSSRQAGAVTMRVMRAAISTWILLAAGVASTCAWDYEVHRVVNQLALASLPPEFPSFVTNKTARERIAFLSGEPDRWRNTPDLPFRHANGPDHFLDIDDLPLFNVTPEGLPPFRYDYLVMLATNRAANPERFNIDAAKDADHTRWLPGFLPWTITEQYAKLKSAFSYLKALEDAGTASEVENARQNVIYCMGVLGHYVGDGAQPLHTTKHYNGWVGENPKGYTTSRRFHAWIDSGYLLRIGITAEPLLPQVRPARLLGASEPPGIETNIFNYALTYLVANSRLVEPLYELDRAGKLSSSGAVGAEGREFLSRQLLLGAQTLGDLWLTAWRHAPADTFLVEELSKRKGQKKLRGKN